MPEPDIRIRPRPVGEVPLRRQARETVNAGVPPIDQDVFALHVIDAALFAKFLDYGGGVHPKLEETTQVNGLSGCPCDYAP